MSEPYDEEQFWYNSGFDAAYQWLREHREATQEEVLAELRVRDEKARKDKWPQRIISLWDEGFWQACYERKPKHYT